MLKKIKSLITLNNGVLVVALLITLTWAWGTVNAIQKNFTLQRQVDEVAEEVAYQELENQTLEFQKKYYESREYLELAARERLNKALPGEKVLILPPVTVKAIEEKTQDPATVPIVERSNFQQWMYFLFGSKS